MPPSSPGAPVTGDVRNDVLDVGALLVLLVPLVLLVLLVLLEGIRRHALAKT
ncbi:MULTISPECIES: hypothetical protein [unclassified Streptomyces]|uniref:hypothetical protein n=1 Tax=unclassified Streptomyces TaxID=2593676 RepID=UPI002E18B555|nr:MULTISPECIES: hypothetical protein [unclassified Streptomyces]